MAKTASINMRIEPEVKEEAEKIFNNFGITTTDAINMFLRQVINYKGLPFELRMPPNDETRKALQEAEEITKNPDAYKTYNNFQEIVDEIKEELKNE